MDKYRKFIETFHPELLQEADDYVSGVDARELPAMLGTPVNQKLHNFFTEAKNALGIYGNIDDMVSDIGKQVCRAAKELSRQYVDETVMFKDAEHTDPYREVHYKISWGNERGENVTELWDDAVFADNEWTGLYCLNVATDETCDEFEYIKEIERIKK